MQQVNLISSPENILEIFYTACRSCYSSEKPIDIYSKTIPIFDFCDTCKKENCEDCDPNKIRKDIEDKNYEKMVSLVDKVLESGHHSTIEHCQFVFSISGVSRACTHQLVRHRHMQFSQKSQRYVTEKEQFEYVTPESIKKKAYTGSYDSLMFEIQDLYNCMIKDGIPAEDARFVLPNAATSSLVVSLNVRELIHLANERLCCNAQWEIRNLVHTMCELVVNKEPFLEKYLQPKCVKNQKCNEIKSCGRYGNK